MMFKTPGCLFRGSPCLGKPSLLHFFFSEDKPAVGRVSSIKILLNCGHAKPIKILLLWRGIRFWASRSWAWSPCLRNKNLVIRYDGNPAFISHWAVQFGYHSSSKYHYLGGPYQTTKVYWSGADIRWFTLIYPSKSVISRRTCNVFPRPMSSAKMQPKPFRALFTSQW